VPRDFRDEISQLRFGGTRKIPGEIRSVVRRNGNPLLQSASQPLPVSSVAPSFSFLRSARSWKPPSIGACHLPRHAIEERERERERKRAFYVFPLFFSVSSQQQDGGNSCSDGQLSGIMPDVAMATASFGALHLIEEQELELDLGDGASHQLPHVSPSSGGTIEAAHRSSLPHQHQRHFSGPPPPPYVYHHAGTALPRFI